MVEIAQNLFTTRRGSLLVGGAAAVLAGLILLVYLHAYRNSLNSGAAPATVLVAKNLIQKGTPGNIIGSSDQFQVASVPKGQLQTGAITDPAALAGRVAVTDIYPGQQLTANYFAYAPPGTLQTNITGTDRAISLSIDAEHGMIGQISAGDSMINRGNLSPPNSDRSNRTLVLAKPSRRSCAKSGNSSGTGATPRT